MAITFLDSAEHYATGDVLEKWSSVSGTVSPSTVKFRTGSASLKIVFPTGVVQKNLIGPALTTVSVGWAALYEAAQFTNQGGIYSPVFFREGSNSHCFVRIQQDGSLNALRNANFGSGDLLGRSAPGLVKRDVWHYYEVVATISDTVGVLKVYLDGGLVLDVTLADTRFGGSGVVDNIRLDGAGDYTDDVYIAEAGTVYGDMGVHLLLPSGAGSNAAWAVTGAASNFQAVDENPPNDDTDYVSSSTVGQRDSHAMGNLGGAYTTIRSLQAVFSGRKDDGTARSVGAVVVSGATTSDGAGASMGDTYAFYVTQYLTDPNTGAAWTNANINLAECGVKVTA